MGHNQLHNKILHSIELFLLMNGSCSNFAFRWDKHFILKVRRMGFFGQICGASRNMRLQLGLLMSEACWISVDGWSSRLWGWEASKECQGGMFWVALTLGLLMCGACWISIEG